MPAYTDILRQRLPPAESDAIDLKDNLKKVTDGLKNVYKSRLGAMLKMTFDTSDIADGDLIKRFVDDRSDIEEVVIFYLKLLAESLLTAEKFARLIWELSSECSERYRAICDCHAFVV
jgi:hypothetical protein